MLLVPTRIAPSNIHGIGVFALEPIAKGQAGWQFWQGLDMEFSPDIAQGLPAHVQTFFTHYGYLDRKVKRIILCFDDARFVNHSDDPNVAADYAQDPYGLDVALRDISPGEELTMDYGGFEETARQFARDVLRSTNQE